MPLVTTEKILLDAQKNKYAIGAFNVENMEMVMAVVAAAEELKSPVILQTTPSTVKYASLDYFYANAKVAAQKASVPVAIHLDHGNSFELAMQALRVGYTSIMIDGSHESFEDNIKVTKAVVDACAPSKVSVGSLAVAIGTAHGVYKGEPKLDLDRLSEIKEVVSIPLVLHGTSGVPDDTVSECVRRGICKVNYATDLRIAFSKGVKEYLAQNPDAIDPKKYCSVGREEVKKYVMSKMHVVGSVNKA